MKTVDDIAENLVKVVDKLIDTLEIDITMNLTDNDNNVNGDYPRLTTVANGVTVAINLDMAYFQSNAFDLAIFFKILYLRIRFNKKNALWLIKENIEIPMKFLIVR